MSRKKALPEPVNYDPSWRATPISTMGLLPHEMAGFHILGVVTAGQILDHLDSIEDAMLRFRSRLSNDQIYDFDRAWSGTGASPTD